MVACTCRSPAIATVSLVSASKVVALTGIERSETTCCVSTGAAGETANATVIVIASMNAKRTISQASSASRASREQEGRRRARRLQDFAHLESDAIGGADALALLTRDPHESTGEDVDGRYATVSRSRC